MRARYLSLVGLIITLLCAWSLPVAASQETDASAFTFAPVPGDNPALTEKGYFVYELDSGDHREGHVRLTNPTDRELTVILTAVDAVTAMYGGSAYAMTDAEVVGSGQWITLDDTEVQLAPGEERLVSFTIQLPAAVDPGQYLAGIAAYEDKDADTASGDRADNQVGTTIKLQTRYVIGLQVNIQGTPTFSLTIPAVDLDVRSSGVALNVMMLNDGSAFVQPSGSLTVTDALETETLKRDIDMGLVITGTTGIYPVQWPGSPAPGVYSVRVELEYGDNQVVTYEDEIEVGEVSVQTVSIPELSVEEVRSEPDDALQFVNVAVALENPGATVSNARVTLRVTRDGEPVEDFILGETISFQQGSAQVSQRYLPPTGWELGTYTFTVTVEEVDTGTGNAVELVSAESETTVTVE